MRYDLLTEDESRMVIDEVNSWCRRTGTNYNKLVTAARVNETTRYAVRIRGRRLTIQTADRLRNAMRVHPHGISKDDHKVRVRVSSAEKLERQRSKRRRDFPAEAVRVDRSPCPKCGARRDLGCEHWARFECSERM
jgi:hypothetical protein